jgi:hypothetical protein
MPFKGWMPFKKEPFAESRRLMPRFLLHQR